MSAWVRRWWRCHHVSPVVSHFDQSSSGELLDPRGCSSWLGRPNLPPSLLVQGCPDPPPPPPTPIHGRPELLVWGRPDPPSRG
ncbi:hypothetical protein E2562_034419 [Oryza meyeriana var. granulata]|uniref:Uncharacterized protein n=1 Tax=Oryza meyeriana var. granulata TaxID=110450 RepID=A0A6G1BRD0_9ORYZ|nr:hypothetical protein E2562_034419 [Oryza meyeriana var. granulata]